MPILFKDAWLKNFYLNDEHHRNIPPFIKKALYRKIQILDAATDIKDLSVLPGNRFEYLAGPFKGWCSIRVNKQYRLIFKWNDNKPVHVFLDPHTYKK